MHMHFVHFADACTLCTFNYFSERELAKDEVMLLQDTKTRLSSHISELEQELKRCECLIIIIIGVFYFL